MQCNQLQRKHSTSSCRQVFKHVPVGLTRRSPAAHSFINVTPLQLTSVRYLPIGSLHVVQAAKGFGAPQRPASKAETCSCGSKKTYKECCEPFHQRKGLPATPEELLRARFSGFCKNEQDYVVSTFHPDYLSFKYPDDEGDAAADQLKRDVNMACNSYEYSKLKVLKIEPGSNPNEAFIEFQYNSVKRAVEKRTNSRHTREKAFQPERNLDGSIKTYATVERSRFINEPEHGWRFVDYQLQEYPSWMAEAKEAELKSMEKRKQAQQQQ